MSATELQNLSLLVLEDEPLLRRQLAAHLTRFGAEVTTAESLAAARQQLRSGQFDIALLDVNLPDGVGTDLLREQAYGDSASRLSRTAVDNRTANWRRVRLTPGTGA